MALGGARDEALEPRFADVDVAHRRRQHAAVADQEGLGGEAPDRHARRDRDARAVQHAVGDLDRARRLEIQPGAALEIDQPAREAVLLVDAARSIAGESCRLSSPSS